MNRFVGGFIIPLPSTIGFEFVSNLHFYFSVYRTSGAYPDSFQHIYRRFINEDITVTLPDGMDACDIGTITVWCQPFSANLYKTGYTTKHVCKCHDTMMITTFHACIYIYFWIHNNYLRLAWSISILCIIF